MVNYLGQDRHQEKNQAKTENYLLNYYLKKKKKIEQNWQINK